jgi:hypothetical protein
LKASNATSSRKDSPPPAEHPRNGASSSSTAERFSLSGPSIVLDQRIHAYRRDIADIALAGQLFAPHYARPMIRTAGADATVIRAQAAEGADVVSELNPGDEFAVLDISGGWAWGYRRLNHHVGYVPADQLASTESD